MDGLIPLGSDDEVSDENGSHSRKAKRPRRSLRGSEKPTNLSFYSGEEKDLLNLTKEFLKLKIFTMNAYPDIEETNQMIKSSYEEAATALSVSESSDLGACSLILFFGCPPPELCQRPFKFRGVVVRERK